MDSIAELERGRNFFARRAWASAYRSLSRADETAALDADALELLARAAYMLGRDDDYVSGLRRAHDAHLRSGDGHRAVRCAFWIGHSLFFRGQMGPANGWFAHARRQLAREEGDSVEDGYLLIPELMDRVMAGDAVGAEPVAQRMVEIGQRFHEEDLVALGLMEHGHAVARQGRTGEGLRLVDETMVAVTTGTVSPIVAGIVYCNTIAFCRSVFETRRAREWTAALTLWCHDQPEMMAHTGQCLVHRAELMMLGGEWNQALDELGRLHRRHTRGALNQLALGEAAYQRAEVHRLQGDFTRAEPLYVEASHKGKEPQPGLALLRLAEGRTDAAAAAIRRAVSESVLWADRAALLPAYVEIMLSVDDEEAADGACRQLAEIARQQDTDTLSARCAYAYGSVALARGDADASLPQLRRAWQTWMKLDVPYEAARARAKLGLCCRLLGDHDTAALHLADARRTLAELGAEPDMAQLRTLNERRRITDSHGLSERELEVLRLVAAGRRNRQVASDLVISEHTVARHLQNIFAKLGVSTRTQASAFAHDHGLLHGGKY